MRPSCSSSPPIATHTVPQTLRERLAAQYAEPHRRYHTITHVNAMLEHLAHHVELANDPALITAAIWYHDAVYDTRRDDNEERSALLARSDLESSGWLEPAINRVMAMILATRHHQAVPADSDMQLFLDIDLSILGTHPDAYANYCSAVREEYQWVPEADYVAGRSRVLRSFIARESIYRTPTLVAAWESFAQLNLRRELDELARWVPQGQ